MLSASASASAKSNKNKQVIEDEYKRCILIWNPDVYGLTVLTMENAKNTKYYEKPIFYIPIKTFMRCGAIWSALNLCTIFWEQRPYHIERTFQETERIKGAYLVAFASDVAPICKKWAEQCFNTLYDWPRKIGADEDEVFVEIIVFQNSLKSEIINAAKMYMLQISETDEKDIFNIFESSIH